MNDHDADKNKPLDQFMFLQTVESLQRAINNISVDQETILQRLTRLEKEGITTQNLSAARPETQEDPPFQSRRANSINPPEDQKVGSSDVQREYECIKDSLSKVKLPNEIKLLENKTGIKREDQQHLMTITKSARFTETCLKLLSTFTDGASDDDLANLYTMLVAHINSLQSEYTSLLVKGQFDKDTASLFKCLERNTTQFTPNSLENLKTAAEISATKNRLKPEFTNRGDTRGRGYYRRFNNYRRGAYGFSSRGFAPGTEIPRERDDQE